MPSTSPSRCYVFDPDELPKEMAKVAAHHPENPVLVDPETQFSLIAKVTNQ